MKLLQFRGLYNDEKDYNIQEIRIKTHRLCVFEILFGIYFERPRKTRNILVIESGKPIEFRIVFSNIFLERYSTIENLLYWNSR
jgi:hypothetical protein